MTKTFIKSPVAPPKPTFVSPPPLINILERNESKPSDSEAKPAFVSPPPLVDSRLFSCIGSDQNESLPNDLESLIHDKELDAQAFKKALSVGEKIDHLILY